MIKKCSKFLVAGLIALSPIVGYAQESPVEIEMCAQDATLVSWKEFHLPLANCSVLFPGAPKHVSHQIRGGDVMSSLQYDAYVSPHADKSVYMLLIAHYPKMGEEAAPKITLDGFLNSVAMFNPRNQLMHAKMKKVDGNEVLDFLMRSGGVYIRGQAMVVKNRLYLTAMECSMQKYTEAKYDSFVNSFKISGK